MPRQLGLVEEVIERELRLQRELAGQLVAPVEAVFDLLEQRGATLRRRAEALEASVRARGDCRAHEGTGRAGRALDRQAAAAAALAKVEMAVDGGPRERGSRGFRR
jgi:hypothetical protein